MTVTIRAKTRAVCQNPGILTHRPRLTPRHSDRAVMNGRDESVRDWEGRERDFLADFWRDSVETDGIAYICGGNNGVYLLIEKAC